MEKKRSKFLCNKWVYEPVLESFYMYVRFFPTNDEQIALNHFIKCAIDKGFNDVDIYKQYTKSRRYLRCVVRSHNWSMTAVQKQDGTWEYT